MVIIVDFVYDCSPDGAINGKSYYGRSTPLHYNALTTGTRLYLRHVHRLTLNDLHFHNVSFKSRFYHNIFAFLFTER